MSVPPGPHHGLPYDVNASMLFTELDLLRRPAAAAAAGFDAVEFWWPFASAVPDDRDVDRFVWAIADAGVSLVSLNFCAGDMPAGDRGLLSWPGRAREFRDSVAVAIGIADRLGCRMFNALYGNRADDLAPAVQDELALSHVDFAAREAARIDATVLLEPVSGVPRYPLRRAAQVRDVIDKVEQSNVALLADLYHLSVNGEDLDTVLGEHVDITGHVQIADVPGRGAPGTGALELERHLATLAAGGYRGYVGLEYAPASSSADAFTWLPTARRTSAGIRMRDRE